MQIGGHRGKWNRKILDVGVLEIVKKRAEGFFATENATAQGPVDIQQGKDLPVIQQAHPFFEAFQLTGGIGGANKRAHGCTGDNLWANAHVLEKLEHPDMGEPFCGPTT